MKRLGLVLAVLLAAACIEPSRGERAHLVSVSVLPALPVVGDAVSVSVTLDRPALGQVTVALESDNAAVLAVASTVTVDGGQTTGQATGSADAEGSATLTATLATDQVTADVAVTFAPALPVVSVVTPPHGLATSTVSVVIGGSDFDPAATVTVGGASVTCIVDADDTIRCDLPDNTGTAAALDVTVTNPSGSDTLTDGFTYTGVMADPGATFFCNLQFPATLVTAAGTPTASIFGQIFIQGTTDSSDVAVPGIQSQVGYGADGSDPQVVNWIWEDMAANGAFDFTQNNDEHTGTLTVDTAGAYDYATRFTVDGGLNFYYCDVNGSDDGYSSANAGDLTVN